VDYFGQRQEIPGDTVIVAVGSKPQRALLGEIEEMIPELKSFYIVGDCISPRTALEAIAEAAKVANEI
jgi:hypothetical protein